MSYRKGKQSRYLHLYQKIALQESFLNVFRITSLAFIQTVDPVVVEGIMVINTITEFGSGANKNGCKFVQMSG
jgi:hypothetical protein